MATTVDAAFSQFLADTVRLDSGRTKTARASKKWLIDEIVKFPNDYNFPKLHSDVSIDFGSFSRKTKIRPLDDIDIMIILHAQGATYNEGYNQITITNTNNVSQFDCLCFDGATQLNSIKIINKFKEYLGKIPQYKKADIKRNQDAVTLELQSYEWVYDIVPCFITTPELNGREYYLIPDGDGNWKKTDPRIDQNRITTINSNYDVSVHDVIRLIKYWNRRPTMPSMQSYLLENIVLNFFDNGIHTKYVDLEVRDVFAFIANAILNEVPDPKGIQGNLNTLSYDQRNKVRERALSDNTKAVEARTFEHNAQMKEAINRWRDIFGDAFPIYQS